MNFSSMSNERLCRRMRRIRSGAVTATAGEFEAIQNEMDRRNVGQRPEVLIHWNTRNRNGSVRRTVVPQR